MCVLNNGLILMGFQPSDQMIARGLIILIAVTLTPREPNR
jgi:ribose transport system permease protein